MKTTRKDTNGTHFHFDTITATYNQLRAILGEHDEENGDKTTYEWVRETNNGDVVTIYDWKEWNLNKDQRIDWHIGAFTKKASQDAQKEIKIALEMLTRFSNAARPR